MKTKVYILKSFLFVAFFSIFTFQALAEPMIRVEKPEINWKVMHLPHFDLIYDAKHQELANLYADRLESNISILSQYFDFFPEKTAVVINDRTDLTNGFATPIPYRMIQVFPVMPGPMDSITDYGDWARELTMHEYTHILSFEPRRGIVKGLYYTFGNVITPNILLPRWWLEGIAVDMETRTSSKGRLRSPMQDASLRAYVTEDTLNKVDLADIAETQIPTWPQGTRAYLFGSLMWSEMIQLHGAALIKNLHQKYGGRVPFFIEGAVQDLTGSSYYGFFDRMMDSVQQKAKSQMITLDSTSTNKGTELIIKNQEENFSPTISPDGLKMIFLSKNDSIKRSVHILIRPSTEVAFEGKHEIAEIDQDINEGTGAIISGPKKYHIDEDSPPGGTIQRVSWFPDSKKFIYDKLDEIDRFHEASDLWIYDLTTRKSERLTFDFRAREASVSPDGNTIAFVKLDAGNTAIGLINNAAKKHSIVYLPKQLQTRISFPTFVDANQLIFSERADGAENLRLLNLKTNSVITILPNFPDARFATFDNNSLFFTSSVNGTSNLYQASADFNSARPVTHTKTYIAASSFDKSLKELYATELTSRGFQIRRFEQKQISALPAKLPKIETLLGDRYPAQASTVNVVAKPEPEEYSSWPYTYPHYWLPDVYFSSSNSKYGFVTAGSDPLERHVYSLSASYDTVPKEGSLNLQYINNQTPAMILLNGLDYQTNIVNTATRFRLQNYQIASLWQAPASLSTDLMGGLGWNWIAKKYTTSRTEANGPQALMRYSTVTLPSGAQISAESGHALSLSATNFLKNGALENETFNLYQFSGMKYFTKWLPKHHVVMAKVQGQYVSENVSLSAGAFSLPYAPFQNMNGNIYVMRGYLNGQFLGKSMTNYNLEYRMPIANLYRGAGTSPLYVKRLHGAIVADGLNLDGYAYNKSQEVFERAELNKVYWSSGAEIKADITLGYHFPLTFFVGYYVPMDSRYRDGQQWALGFQL